MKMQVKPTHTFQLDTLELLYLQYQQISVSGLMLQKESASPTMTGAILSNLRLSTEFPATDVSLQFVNLHI